MGGLALIFWIFDPMTVYIIIILASRFRIIIIRLISNSFISILFFSILLVRLAVFSTSVFYACHQANVQGFLYA